MYFKIQIEDMVFIFLIFFLSYWNALTRFYKCFINFFPKQVVTRYLWIPFIAHTNCDPLTYHMYNTEFYVVFFSGCT